MKTIFLIALLLTANAFAALKGAPYMPESDARFNTLELADTALGVRMTAAEVQPSVLATSAYTLDGLQPLRQARATINCATAANCVVGAHSLGVALPAKALIIQSFYYSVVQPVSGGSGSIAVHCEDANNIITAANLTSKTVGTITTGVETGAASDMLAAIASPCNITATMTSADYTAGQLNVFVNYVVTD